MNINTQDIFTLITVLLYLLITAFSLFLPLLVIFNDQKKALQFSIPLSWAIQILFGYVFYIFAITNFYPVIFFPIILAINILSYLKLKKRKVEIIPKFDKKIAFYLLGMLYLVQAIYYRFYDSLVHVGPGNPDAAAHLVMLKQIAASNLIGNIFYAPGFHLLILPLAHFTDNYGLSRFSGPVIGMFILMGVYFLLRDKVKLTSSILLLILFSFPLFGKFIIQTIGFFPTVVSFLFFPAILFSLTDHKISFRQYFGINLIIILAMAVTVPYFFVQYLIFIVMLLIVVSFIAHQKTVDFAVLFIGYLVAFGHVFLETQVLHNGVGFPTIRTIEQTVQGPATSSNYSTTAITNILETQDNSFITKIANNSLFKSIILPLANTGLDVIKIKNILPVNNFLYILSYLATLFSFVLIFLSLKRKNLGLIVLSTAVFVYGISTITGFFEMSDYRGRSGYYFFMLAIFLIVEIFDLLNSGKVLVLKKVALAILFLGSVYLSIRMPMEFPRLYYPGLFRVVHEINDKHPEKTAVMSPTTTLFILNNNIENIDYDKSNLNNDYPLSIVILEKKRFDPGTTYQSVVFTHYWDVAKNDPKYLQGEADFLQKTLDIRNSNELKSYTLYWQNENIEVFTKPAIN